MWGNTLLRLIKWKQGSRLNQFLMAIMVTIPTLNIGMVVGWMSPAIPQLLATENNPIGAPISSSDMAWLASSIFLVSVPCMAITGYIADRIGRKITILITSFSLLICWMIKIAWPQSTGLIVARGISGIGNAGSYVIPPIYINEISDPTIRGALGSTLILLQNSGFLAIYVLGDQLSFKAVLWVAFTIPLLHFIIFIFLPDSPSFLVKKGKIQEATEVLAWLRSVDNDDKGVEEDIRKLEIESKVHSDDEKSFWRILLEDKNALKAFGITVFILLAQEMCGYLILLTFASVVFGQADFASVLRPNEQTMVLGGIQLIGSITAIFLVERIGRKPLLTVTSFLTGVGMIILGTWFYEKSIEKTLPGWIPLLAMSLSIFSTAAGFQPTPFVIMPELFNFRLRGVISSVAISLTALVDFAQTATYEYITQSIGLYGIFWMYGVICFTGTLFTVAFVPETKGKAVEEIYREMEEKSWFKKQDQNQMTTTEL